MTAAIDSPRSGRRARPTAIDPVTVEVIRRRLVAISDEVDVNITRTAFSPYIYEYKDYAVGIVDANGDLICQCTAGMPVFVADVMRAAVQDGLELYGRGRSARGRRHRHQLCRHHRPASQQRHHVHADLCAAGSRC